MKIPTAVPSTYYSWQVIAISSSEGSNFVAFFEAKSLFDLQREEAYILTDWTKYHTWEDGRSNYAWDLSALNDYMMTYSNQGLQLQGN